MKIVIVCLLLFVGLETHAQTIKKKILKKKIGSLYQSLEDKDLESLLDYLSDDFIFYDPSSKISLNGPKEVDKYLTSVFQIQKNVKIKLTKISFLNTSTVLIKGKWRGFLNEAYLKTNFYTIFIFNQNGLIEHQTDHFDLESFVN